LLQIIQRHLSSEEKDRLAYLRQQNETGIIRNTEHQELLMYIDRVEQQDAERAEAMIKLAELRQVNLKTVINEFLPTRSNVA
jgi:aconitase A